MRWKRNICPALGWCLLLGLVRCVDISFDDPKAGYFLKSTYRKYQPRDPQFEKRSFVFTQASDSYRIKAESGPFEVHQTIPDSLLQSMRNSDAKHTYSLTHNEKMFNMEVSAHIVTDRLTPKFPLLQVLIHASPQAATGKVAKHSKTASLVNMYDHMQQWCGQLFIRQRDQEMSAVCILSDKDNACVAGLNIPSTWWTDNGTNVDVWYSFSRVEQNHECASASNSIVPGRSFSNTTVAPKRFITRLTFTGFEEHFEEIKDQHLLIYVPTETFHPGAKFEVPVKLEVESDLLTFIMRARVRQGLKITGAKVMPGSAWGVHFELIDRQKTATVTAFVRDASTYTKKLWIQDIFTWQLEVDSDITSAETSRIIWSIEYEKTAKNELFQSQESRLLSVINIQGHERERIMPVLKVNEILNLASLTGREQIYPLYVYSVDETGSLDDISHRTACHSADEDVLKVASDCSSVYLDGSETRGSYNATIIAKKGRYTAFTMVTVWIPESHLDIQLSDNRLSQIRSWRVSNYHKSRRKKRGVDFGLLTHPSVYLRDESYGHKNRNCHLRLQQSLVNVYTRFFIMTPYGYNYLKSKRAFYDITDLINDRLRISDTRIAKLDGNIIQGHGQGRTEIQVLSPKSRVMAAKEIRVGKDKVMIERLLIKLVTGLSLDIKVTEEIAGSLTATTSIQSKILSKYQEGVLDISLQFSDGTTFPLRYVAPEDYFLEMSTLNHHVIGVAPYVTPFQPKIVALGQGRGELLKVVLKLGDYCVRRKSRPLAVNYVHVDSDFTQDAKMYLDHLQSDGHYDNRASDRWDMMHNHPDKPTYNIKLGNTDSDHFENKGRSKFDKSNQKVIPIGTDLGDLAQDSPAAQQQIPISLNQQGLSPLEIGMYVLLAVFCVAIIVFMVNCIVFMVRYKRKRMPKISREPISNANDWVWIGSATLERSAINTHCSKTLMPEEDFNGNHTQLLPPSGSNSANSSAPSSNRNSGVSTYKGSECSIRITANPHPEVDDGVEQQGLVAGGPEWDYEAMGMSYDQLMDYFDNLKESTA